MKKRLKIVFCAMLLVVMQVTVAIAGNMDFPRSDTGTVTGSYGTLTMTDNATIRVDEDAFFDEYILSNGTVSSTFTKLVIRKLVDE